MPTPDRSVVNVNTVPAGGWGELAHPARLDSPAAHEPPWRDNAYVCFWDAANEVNGVVHVSTSPNAEGRRARASISLRGVVVEVIEDLAPAMFVGESVAFELDGRVRVRADGLEADLDLAPCGRYCDYSPSGVFRSLDARRPLAHYQSATTVTGTVVAGDERSAVEAFGMRDRTWGFRDESATISEHIVVLAEIDGRLLTVMKFRHADGSTATAGFVLSDEEPVAVTELCEITRDAAGLFAGASVVVAGEERLDLRARERTAGFWVPVGSERQGPTMSAYDEFVTLQLGDGRRAHGMIEQGIVRRLA